MKYAEIRKKYLDYLKKHGHSEIINASLVPENDPTILFTPAGMSPIVPYLLGNKHPQGKKLTNVQRCIRTGDIDEVGDNTHLTFFEMLGNWSLNDYYKKEAVEITFSFLVNELNIDPEKLYLSVFQGNKVAPQDKNYIQAIKDLFQKVKIEARVGDRERIQLFDKNKCWWELSAGGPCGPCSEIFYDTGKPYCSEKCNVNCDCGKFVELGNNVFMEFLKTEDKYQPLSVHNVDFGGGIARLAMIMQNVDSVYEVDIMKPIINKVKSIAKQNDVRSTRIVCEHINSAVFIIMDEITPSNTEQGYILRRLIRRAIRHAKMIGINELFTKEIALVVIEKWKELYPELIEKKEYILKELEKEEEKFAKTVENGLKEVDKILMAYKQSYSKDSLPVFENKNGLSFYFYETYGFPAEMFLEELKSRGMRVNDNLFWKTHNNAFQEHQDKSREGVNQRFKGGLADNSGASIKYHTASHLLNAALKEIVGTHVYQKGSNITPERLRFDFPNETKLTSEQVKKVEDWVNDKIKKELPITFQETTLEEAKEQNAEGVFQNKYSDKVKVYTIKDGDKIISREICGGPHVSNTGELGVFQIIKQENIGSGVKRIKAVLNK